MDVYLIPVGGDRYELYCEPVAQEEGPAEPPPSGRVARLVHKVTAAAAKVEREQQQGMPSRDEAGLGWIGRAKRRTLCWVAERIAEWRLLWRLRNESEAALVAPGDLTGEDAWTLARAMLVREANRHRKWTIVDGLLLCGSAIVTIIPGPNPLAYYFGFRFVGHLLSYRGARHGLNEVRWSCRPSPELSELRTALQLAPAERHDRVRAVERALQLQHLATFFERTAIRSA